MKMDMTRFQSKVMANWYGPRDPTYAALALAGEAGEVANEVKKALRDHDGNIEARKKQIIDELGDTIFYAAALADSLGVSFEELASQCIEKADLKREKRKDVEDEKERLKDGPVHHPHQWDDADISLKDRFVKEPLGYWSLTLPQPRDVIAKVEGNELVIVGGYSNRLPNKGKQTDTFGGYADRVDIGEVISIMCSRRSIVGERLYEGEPAEDDLKCLDPFELAVNPVRERPEQPEGMDKETYTALVQGLREEMAAEGRLAIEKEFNKCLMHIEHKDPTGGVIAIVVTPQCELQADNPTENQIGMMVMQRIVLLAVNKTETSLV